MIARHYNTACQCKRAQHVHGTRVCYVIDKCRCALCGAAAVNAARMARHQAMQAKWGNGETPYVDASAAVAHIRTLQAAGLGWKEVAKRAGLRSSVIYPLLYGRPDRNGGKPRTKCRPATRDAILSVPTPTPEQLAPGALVDATPTRNRVRALAVMGYPASEVARQAGFEPQRLRRLLAGTQTLTAETHSAVRGAYSRLWSTRWEPASPAKREAARRARAKALSMGWPSPLDLDSDGAITPHDQGGEAASTASDATQADGSRQVTVLEEWAELVSAGELPDRAAHRLGVAPKTVERYAYRFAHKRVISLLGRVA